MSEQALRMFGQGPVVPQPSAEVPEAAGQASLPAPKYNYFKQLADGDPPIGIHQTLVGSGQSVRLPDLDRAPDIWQKSSKGWYNLGGAVVELAIVVPTPMSVEPLSERSLHRDTLSHDMNPEINAAELTGSVFITQGRRNPLAASFGLRSNPEIASRYATNDGTVTGTPLPRSEVYETHDDETISSVTIANRPCFLPFDPNDQSFPKSLSIVRPKDDSFRLVGLVVNETDGIDAIPLDDANLKAIAEDDPDVALIGWIGIDKDSTHYYGRDALLGRLGREGASLPCAMVNTSVELAIPAAAKKTLVSQVEQELLEMVGADLEDLQPAAAALPAGAEPYPVRDDIADEEDRLPGMESHGIANIINGKHPGRLRRRGR